MRKKPSEYMTVNAAARFLHVHSSVILYHIDSGRIQSSDGKIERETVKRIHALQDQYVSLQEYLSGHNSDRFDSNLVRHREKFINFLEENSYFGLQTTDADTIFLIPSDRTGFFIAKEDIPFLDYKSQMFFEDFEVSEYEKTSRILSKTPSSSNTKRYVQEYLEFISDESNIYTPSLTNFVKIVFELPDILSIEDNDIIDAIGSADTRKTKEFLIGFFSYVSSHEDVPFHHIEFKKAESTSVAAYSYKDFAILAKVLFNKTYDKAHGLTAKALENSNYAEMWMFLSCHYVCGWRASDICSRWVYPNLKDNNNVFGINTNTLKEDILAEKISDNVYESISLYVIRRIEMSYNVPQKTGKGKLRSEILPELRIFFGKLTLIAEYHHLRTGEGYMKAYRTPRYRNWVACRKFFGEDVYAVTGRQALSSRRLNKSYLQGIEQTARDNGNTTIVSHVIASYARSHADIDTTVAYLKDHGLTGESSGVVLFMMMQRGVFSVSLYHALLAAFPDAFGQLTAQEQTKLIEKVPLSAFELEVAGSAFAAAEEAAAELARGKADIPKMVLKAMLAIGQGQGKAKDEGVYCTRKALGLCCNHPLFESCLANLCPHHVFTSEGMPALLQVIQNYAEKARITGNQKYTAALQKCIIPAFQEVINAVIKEMSCEERAAMKLMIEEALHE